MQHPLPNRHHHQSPNPLPKLPFTPVPVAYFAPLTTPNDHAMCWLLSAAAGRRSSTAPDSALLLLHILSVHKNLPALGGRASCFLLALIEGGTLHLAALVGMVRRPVLPGGCSGVVPVGGDASACCNLPLLGDSVPLFLAPSMGCAGIVAVVCQMVVPLAVSAGCDGVVPVGGTPPTVAQPQTGE